MSVSFFIPDTSHQVNFSNRNAFVMQEAMGLLPVDGGTWAGDRLFYIHNQLFWLINKIDRREPFKVSEEVEGNFVSFGLDQQQIKDKAERLLALVVVAIQLKKEISFG